MTATQTAIQIFEIRDDPVPAQGAGRPAGACPTARSTC